MNKKQRIAAWIIGISVFTIFFKIGDIQKAFMMSVSWVLVGALLMYVLRDKK